MGIQYVIGSAVQWDVMRGDTESFGVQWCTGNVSTPVDLTGYTAALLGSDGVAIPGTVAIPSPADGRVLVTFSSTQTAVMVDQYYRVQVNQGAFKKTLLQGRIDVRGPSD